MDTEHITRLAKAELGSHARAIYHQDLTSSRPAGARQLKVDELGGGNLTFVDTGVPNSQPVHEYTPGGLRLSIIRPIGAATNIGKWAAVKMNGVSPPAAFLLIASFIRPSGEIGSTGSAVGTYATSLLINAGTLMGVTCQFQPEGLRMNLPGTGLMLSRPPISQNLVGGIFDTRNPETFSLALRVTRTAVVGTGRGFFHVGNLEIDSLAFVFSDLPSTVAILDIRAGLGTLDGEDFRASIDLLDIQIWA